VSRQGLVYRFNDNRFENLRSGTSS
jgi:hypothetical protein